MTRKLLLFFVIILSCAFTQVYAQKLSENKKIPNNLLITFERGRIQNDKIQINADGYVFYKSYALKIKVNGIDVTNDNFIVTSPNKSKAKSRKKIKESKKPGIKKQEKLTVSQLKELITVFEKVNFFNFKDKYPTNGFLENSPTQVGCINPGSVEVISIRIGKKIKRVENDLSCSPRQISLKKLTDKISDTLTLVQTKELK